MRAKKAQLSERLMMILILVIILLVVILIFQDRLFYLKKEQTDKDLCKASVQQHVAASFQGIDFIEGIDCSTKPLRIENKDKVGIKLGLANAMYDCYDQFGQGKYEILHGAGVANYCIICHVISFETKTRITQTEFADFLRTTKIPGTDTYYQDFLLGHRTDEDILAQYKQTVNTAQYAIDTSQNYATVFTYLKEGYMTKFLTTGIGSSVGVTLGLVGGVLLAPVTGGGSLMVASIAVGSGVAGGLIGYESGSDVAQHWDSGIILMPYNSIELQKLGCTELPAVQKTGTEPGPSG